MKTKKDMSIRSTIAICLILLSSVGRSQSREAILYFFDKSASVDFREVNEECKAVIRKSLENCSQGNFSLATYYLHANTAGAGAVNKAVMPEFSCKSCKSSFQTTQAKAKFTIDMQKMIPIISETLCAELLKTNNDSGTPKYTDIWGIFQVISKSFSGGADSKKIYLFTDLRHDADGVKVFPKSQAQAIKEAQSHISKIRSNYLVDMTALKGTQVVVILPYAPMKSSHNRFLDVYWSTLFKGFGMEMNMNY